MEKTTTRGRNVISSPVGLYKNDPYIKTLQLFLGLLDQNKQVYLKI